MNKYRNYVIYWAIWLIFFAAVGYGMYFSIKKPGYTLQEISELESKSEVSFGNLSLMPYGRTKILAFKSATTSFNMSSHYWTNEFRNEYNSANLKAGYIARVLPNGTPISVRTDTGRLVFIAPRPEQDISRKLLPFIPLLIGIAVVPFILYVRKTNK